MGAENAVSAINWGPAAIATEPNRPEVSIANIKGSCVISQNDIGRLVINQIFPLQKGKFFCKKNNSQVRPHYGGGYILVCKSVRCCYWKTIFRAGDEFLVKIKLLNQSFGKITVKVVWIFILMVTTTQVTAAPADSNEPDKQQVTRQLAQDWLQIGTKQYERGFYKQAEQSLQYAMDYQESLSAAERRQVNELLEKIRSSVTEKDQIQENIQAADELVRQGELVKAQAILKESQDKKSVTKEQQEIIAKSLKNIDVQIKQQEKEVTEIYDASMDFYRKGQFEKAREGFAKIDSILAKRAEHSKPLDTNMEQVINQAPQVPAEAKIAEPNKEVAVDDALSKSSEPNETEPEVIQNLNKESLFEVAEPKTIEKPEIDKGGTNEKDTDAKGNVMRSYTKAVVSDALVKSQNYIDQRKFDKAKETVEVAEQIVNKNHLYLGDELFEQYSTTLKQQAEKVVQEKSRRSK